MSNNLRTQKGVSISHADRLERRVQIARAVDAGGDPGRVARHFGISIDTVWNAMVEMGLPGRSVVGRGQGLCKNTLAILVAFEHGEDHDDIARRFGKSRRRIRDLYRDAEAAGLAVRMPCTDFQGIRVPKLIKRALESPCGPPGAK